MLPEKLSVRDFAAATAGIDIEQAARRREQCDICPAEGGACDSPYEHLAGGLQPVWSEHGLDYRFCGKWAEYHLRRSIEAFGVPKDLSGKRFRNFEATTPSTEDAKRYAVSYTREFGRDVADPPGMLLVGAPGAGKTHLAIASLTALFVTGKVKTISFRYVPKFLSDLRDALDDSETRKRLMTEACECDLLVLDDLGAERTSDWVREQLGIVTNERWANRRATIVTSNDDLERFAATLGPRAISRLESMLMTVPLQAPDYRAEG